MITITRRGHFSAAHRLFLPYYSDEENLNLEVDFLEGKVPTSENVAIGIWNELEEDIRKLGAILHFIRLEQSENNIIEYFGA